MSSSIREAKTVSKSSDGLAIARFAFCPPLLARSGVVGCRREQKLARGGRPRGQSHPRYARFDVPTKHSRRSN